MAKTSNREPVTLVFSQTVKQGKQREFEKLLNRTIKAARHYGGHEGATVIKDGDRNYHLVYRFPDHETLNHWLNSDIRRQLLEKIKPLVEEDEIKPQKMTGFEAWFNTAAGPHNKQAPRWKMLVATFLGAYPVVVLFQIIVVPHIQKWPLLLRALMFPVIILTIMTYVVMPRITKWLSGWLYK